MIAPTADEPVLQVEFGAVERPMHIHRHAVARWCERVDRQASPAQAASALVEFVSRGRRRGRAPRWMRDRIRRKGACFWVNDDRPDVVVIAVPDRDRSEIWAAVTVLTRDYTPASFSGGTQKLKVDGRITQARRRELRRSA